MELTTGYKETEIGPIPSNWSFGPIGDKIDLLTGFPFPSSEYTDSGVRLLRGSNVKRGETDWSDDITNYWPSVTPDISRYELQPGDLVIAMDGALVGRSYALLKEEDLPALLLQRVARIRSSKIEVDYLAQFFAAQWFAEYSDTVKTHTAIPHISADDIRNFKIPLPPLPEQRAIADALSDVDALIERLDALIAKKRAIKTATMQRLLTGQQRLPGFSAPWTTKRLGNVFDLLRTANNSRKDLADHGDVAYIHYGDIHTFPKSHLDLQQDSLPFIDAAKVQNATPLQNGDLVMVDASEDYEGVGKSIEVSGLNGQHAVAGLHTFLLRGDGAYLADGFKGYMQHMPMLKEALHRIATGTSVYGISKTKIKDVELRLPPVAEQRAIAAVLSDMDVEIEALRARRDKTQAIKQGMMQELLTGRTRLA